jgi:hypothetical protein
MAQPSEESPYRLLVEGLDDHHSVIHLVRRHDFDWDDETKVRPFIHNTGGIDKLLDEIPVTLKGTYERIGIVLDANSDPTTRWNQIRDRVKRAGVDLGESAEPNGTIVEGPGSRIGVWLMPDNSSPGSLESFLGRLAPRTQPIWTYADGVTAEARRQGAPCREQDHAKSVLYTWLAWQEKPGLPFGTALKAGLFETDHEDALRFVAWFRRLFVD